LYQNAEIYIILLKVGHATDDGQLV